MTKDAPSVGATSYTSKGLDQSFQALYADVRNYVGAPSAKVLVDVRSPAEYSGEIVAPPGLPETAQRCGHIPGAANIPWGQAANEDGTFKSADELKALYEGKGITADKDVVAYCRIGERSSHTWFPFGAREADMMRVTVRGWCPGVRRSWTRAGALALAVSLTASACGSAPTASAPAASPSPAPPAKPPASISAPVNPAAPASAKPASGQAPASVSAKPAGSEQAIKVGYIQTLTGPTANVGKDNLDGFNLYLESVGGTMAGRKVEVVSADDGGKPDVGVTKAKQLVESDHVNILMGINLTPVCYAVAAYAREAQVPFAETGNCAAERLTTDPKFKSPYLTRFTFTGTGSWDSAADWSYKHGYRKAIIAASDFGPGLEATDIFASAFIERGGSVVQELHPPAGTTDFGTYLAQLNQDGDFITLMMSGIDGLRFLQQITDLGGPKKWPMVDIGGATKGPNLAQLKQKAVGIVAVDQWEPALDTAMNKELVKAFQDKYPGRPISGDVALGYAGGQILGAALQKVSGNAEDKQALLQALYATNLETVRGPVTLDSDHDVIPTIYAFQLVDQGGAIGYKLLDSYPNSSRTWDRPQSEIDHLDLGGMKGKWVGMTKDQLAKLAKGS